MKKIFVIIALTAIIGFSMTACPSPDDDVDKDDKQSATITPESKPVKDRWVSIDESDTVSISHSVDNDGVCTAIVSGTPEDVIYRWRACVQYAYTAKTYTNYMYVFEAWTETGERTITFEHYWDADMDEELYGTLFRSQHNLTTERKRFSVYGEKMPKGGDNHPIKFQCADTIGTFYVKIISIDEVNWGKFVDTSSTATLNYNVDGDGVCNITVGGTAITTQPAYDNVWKTSALYRYTAEAGKAYYYEFEAWTDGADRPLQVQWYGDNDNSIYYASGYEEETPGNWVPRLKITNERKTYVITDNRPIPKSGPQSLTFQCANQLGTFHVKILGIGYIESEAWTPGVIPWSPPEGGGGGWENPGTLIGTISGTITLTDVPSPAPNVYINVNGYSEDSTNHWNSGDSNITLSGSGTLTNVNWSIPIYENDYNHFSPSTGNFSLYVDLGNDRGFRVPIPAAPYIGSANAGGINLGTVSLKSITLSGTVNVTYNGQTVPIVEITAYYLIQNGDSMYQRTQLSSPAANASWSIALPPFSSLTEISFFYVRGYSANYDEWLFSKQIPTTVNAYNQNVTGITINIGNISNTPVNVTPLTANTWVNGEIVNGGDVKWYSINVTNGTKYYLWWNDSYEGNDSKTLDIDVYAYNSSNNSISLTNHDSAWNSPVSFTASSSGTVYVRVRAYGGYESDVWGTGTYAIVYSTNSSKP